MWSWRFQIYAELERLFGGLVADFGLDPRVVVESVAELPSAKRAGNCTHADQLANGGLSNQGLTKLLSTW